MKKSDNKTDAQPEEIKPEEKKPVTKKPTAAKSTAKKPAAAKTEAAKTEEVKPEETPAEEVKPVEEVKAETPEEVKAEEVKPEEKPTEEKSDKRKFFSNKRNVAIVACAGAAVVALSLGLGLGLGLKKKDDGKKPVEPPAKTAFNAPANVAVSESTISWTAVDNATNGYTLKFAESNKEMTLTVVTYDLLSDKSYLTEGTNTLSVKVNATDTYLPSAYSATVTYTYTITSPVDEKFNAPAGLKVTDNTLSWTAVSGATSYTVKINNDETTVNTNSLDLTTVTDKLVEGKNSISVKVNAVGDKKASDYATAIEYSYTAPVKEEKFDAPAGLSVTGKTLSWTAVSGATSYTVKINDEETTVNTNSLDLTTVTDKLVEGKNSISVKVNAVGDKKASDYSSAVEYTYVDEDKEAAKAFDALIAGLDITANGADEKLDAAKTAYSALSVRAKELAATSFAKLKEEDGKYFVALVENIGTVTEDSGAVIAAASNHYEKLLDKEAANVVTAKATLDTKYSQFEHFYESYITAFREKVEAITIADNSRGEVIDTAKTAIGEADTYYNGQTEKVKDALGVLKGTLDSKKASYAKAVKAELDGYKALAQEALAIIEAESSLTALTAKKTAISEYVLSDVNAAAVEVDADLRANIDAIYLAISKWENSITYAVGELTVSATDDDEANIVSAKAALAKFDSYADYIKADEEVKAAKAATEAVLDTAKEHIETAVNAVKTATEEKISQTAQLIADINQPSQENYDALDEQKGALEAQKTAIEEVDGAYATEYLATLKIGEDGLIEAVEKAIETVEKAKETMLATVVRTEGGEAYSLSGTTLKITLFKTFYNFRDEKITATEGENAPVITTTGTNINGDTIVTVEQDFTPNELNEYVAIIQIVELGDLNKREEDATYTIKVGNSEDTKSLKFGETIGYNPYFSNDNEVIDEEETGFKKAVFNGNFVMNFQADCTAAKYYLDVYNADALTIYGPENAYVKFSEMPLGRIDVTGIKQKYMDENKPFSMADFNRLLANELSDVFVGKEVTVRFMLYGETVTDKVPAFTAMNASVISEAIDFSLVEEDKYYTLPVANLWEAIETVVDKDVMYLVNENLKSSIIDFVNNSLTDAEVTGVTLTADNYTDYLRLKIELFDANDTDKPVLYTKYLDNIAFQAISVEDIIKQWQREYFEENGNVEEPEYKIGIRIAYNAKEGTAITEYFPRAEFIEAQMNGATYERDIVLSKATYVLPDTGMNKSGDFFEFLRDSIGNGKILIDGDALYLEIKFYQTDSEGNEIKVNYAYLFDVDGKAVIYKNKEDAGTEADDGAEIAKLEVGDTSNSYTTIDNFKVNFVEKYYTDGVYPLRWDDGWTFTARYERNTDPEHETDYLFDGVWSDTIAFETKSTPMSTTAQITFDGANFVFFSAFTGVERGGIFTTGGVDKVELHFYKGTTETTDYSIDVTHNKDTGNIKFSYTLDGVTTEITKTISGPAINNGWSNTVDMAAVINEYLTGIESSDSFTGEWKMYTITHLREGSKVFSGGDEDGNVKSDEYTYNA